MRFFIVCIFVFLFGSLPSIAQIISMEKEGTVVTCKVERGDTVYYSKWMLELHGNLLRLRMITTTPEKQRNSFDRMMHLAYEYE